MKRFSMAMTWLALAGLMTTVSCRKPVVGFTNGESRTVTVSAATENGDGSKTSIDGLYVKWSENDEISMNGCKLTLEEGAGGTMGRFTGDVTGDGPYLIGYPFDKTNYNGGTLKLTMPATLTYDTEKEIVPMAAYAEKVGDDVQFRNAVNMLKLQLTGDGTAASKLTSIVLTSASSNLSGDISVEFDGEGNPTFNAITDGEGLGKTMTVSFGNGGLQLGETVKCVYIPLAKIASNEVLTVRFNCANGIYVEKTVTATSAFDAVNNMLDGGVVEVKAVPNFSVDASGTTVEFAPGNLYWDGTAFRFEANQWSYADTWNPSHVSHFYWSKDAAEARAEECAGGAISPEDVFFTNASDFQVSGETAGTWRTLTKDEWCYLLGIGDSYRTNASSLRAWKELDGGTHNGLVILPDCSDASVMGSINSTADLAAHGAVFLPAAGYRNESWLEMEGGWHGCYWSTATDGGQSVRVGEIWFEEGNVGWYWACYWDAHPITLVR